MGTPAETDFDDWLIATFAHGGPFTVLIVLVAIGETTVEPLRSSYLHVVGDETRWPDMAALFEKAGVPWNGVAFFRADRAGLVEDALAKQRLASLVHHLNENRKLLNEGEFFDERGLRLKLEEVVKH